MHRERQEPCEVIVPEKYSKTKVKLYYDLAREHAIGVVERMARDVLLTHPNVVEFVMAMGVYGFNDKQGDTRHLDEFAYMRPLKEFIEEWDDVLKLSGEPMRFTATGNKVTDW